ncbi:class I alpha-mannosidase [Westerdykella ornata]|uniref:alpha-1,2-Mannosidase n=1 Tax=Westerdykella ornata TaxID=318751 RepID=A0A6A6J8F1_WESOR|nr:class I alpha-mannosidase [Westerdykella ornata]KAF2271489.1 class I alpha-mannosidase [Westerdykella ornata]
MRPVKIKPPRNGSYQPMGLRQRRNLKRIGFALLSIIALIYYFYTPFDYSAVDFESHEAYMNDRLHAKGFVSQQSYDWRTAPFFNKINGSLTPLPTGVPRSLPRIQYEFPEETASQKALRESRRAAVRKAFQRTWNSYRKHAWKMDELMPISGKGLDTFGGWGATLVDSLDTLWIMGFKKEFYEAVDAVAHIDFGKSESGTISVFETTIRYLGGMLSAYDLSGEKVLLDKAIQLGELLYRAFDTNTNMPQDRLSLEAAKKVDSQGAAADGNICFAAIGSLTMEFTRLAQVTKEPKFYDAVARVTNFLDRAQNKTDIPGLFPTWINAFTLDFTSDEYFTMGAMADSSYEYFPKMYALLGGLEPVYEKLYKESAPMIDKYLLFRPMLPDTERGEDLLYSGDLFANAGGTGRFDPEMQHLTCFIGGFFALGGRLFKNEHHVALGAKLTEGCIYAYEKMPSGVMPEKFHMVPCESRNKCPWNATKWEEHVLRKSYAETHEEFLDAVKEQKLPPGFSHIKDRRYLLRPEAIESVFIMYRITGHQEYMEHAWNMFEAVQRASMTKFANGQVLDVTEADPVPLPEDKMESFWTAETLKYFYLIFSPPDMISLDDWVFNTEAHPFRRPKSTRT